MKKRSPIWLAIVAIMLLAGAACAPATAPAPASTPAPKAAATSQPIASQTLSPDEKAWQEVVAAAKKEGSVTAYSYNWTGDIGSAIAKGFQERYGIKLDIITGRGAEFIERLKTEQRMGQMVADVFEGGTPHGLNIKMAGLTAQAGNLPALKDLNSFVASPLSDDPEGHALSYSIFVYSPYVNTNLVKPGEEPKTWKDFLDPKWKGKMTIDNPTVSMAMYMMFWPLKSAGVIDMDYLKQLGTQDPIWTTGLVDDVQKLSRGENAVSVFGTAVNTAAPILSGAPIKGITMEPAMSASDIVMEAIKGGPHPNAAKVLLNWMFTAEGQLAYNKTSGTASIVKGAPSFLPPAADVKASRIVMSPPDILNDEANSFNQKVLVKLWGR